jgi:hypothetical protein
MTTLSILTELVISVKYGQGEFPKSMSDEIFYAWILCAFLVVVYGVWRFGKWDRKRSYENGAAGDEDVDMKFNGLLKVGESSSIDENLTVNGTEELDSVDEDPAPRRRTLRPRKTRN